MVFFIPMEKLVEWGAEKEPPARTSSTALLIMPEFQGLEEIVRTVFLLADARKHCLNAARAIEEAKRLRATRQALKIRVSYWCSAEIH